MINICTPFDQVSDETTLIELILKINKDNNWNKNQKMLSEYDALYKELNKHNISINQSVKDFFDIAKSSSCLEYYQRTWKEYQKLPKEQFKRIKQLEQFQEEQEVLKKIKQREQEASKKNKQREQILKEQRVSEKIKQQKKILKKQKSNRIANEALKIILTLIKLTEKNKIIWNETVNTTLKRITRKKYTAELNGAMIDFNVISFKDKSGEDKTNILLVKEKKEKILFQYTLSPTDENTQLLYTKIQNSANYLKKEIKIKGEKRSFAHQKREMQIEYNHFIIRTTLFRCCKNHSLEEVIGILNIITPTGIKIIERISCAYCKDCNCFYMLDSEYKRISAKGILLCQIITYEQYCTMGVLDISKWSSESILKHNGYNVQATKNLSDEQRQVILQNIIDNKILSAHGIVSYINVFIAQKEGLSNYRTAVMKWKKDKQFVLNYDNERKRQIEIDKISKTEVISK